MKTKLRRILLLLLLVLVPFSQVLAAPNTDGFKYRYRLSAGNLKDIGVTNLPSAGTVLYANTNKGHKFSSTFIDKWNNNNTVKNPFFFHQIIGSKANYHGYCLHIGKSAPEHDVMNSEAGKSDGVYFLAYKGFDESKLSSKKQELMSDLLSNGYTKKEGYVHNATNKEKLKMVAMQILVWEVETGGRTSFKNVEPNKYNSSNSLYKGLVKKNSKLLTEYTSIVNNVFNNSTEADVPSSIKNHETEASAYILTYNPSTKKYSITTNDVSPYTTHSDVSGISISGSNALTITSDSYFEDTKKIDLSYTVGSTDSNLKNFYYFKSFNSNGSDRDDQDIILGSKQTTYSKHIYVKCAKAAFSIGKIDRKTKQALYGAEFEIRDASGNPLKFIQSGSNFTYSDSGSTTKIVHASANTYTVMNIPSGDYNLVETAAPKNHILPQNEASRTTKIRVDGDSLYVWNGSSYSLSNEAKVVVQNDSTQVKIIKSGTGGIKLEGIEFKLYQTDKTTRIPLNYGQSQYNYDENGNVETVLVTDKNGEILINYLPVGTYMLEETKPAEGYQLPEDPWYSFTITESNSTTMAYTVSITNAKGEFNFYKIDENGNYLTGGKFELQEYNTDNGRYETVGVKKETSDNANTNLYSIDKTSKQFTFTTNKGIATFKNVESGKKYKIVEIEAPEGYQILDVESSNAVVEIDANGYAKNSASIINKEIIVETDASSNAELIVSINTGQVVIKYGLIIGIILGIIVALIILRKKIKK